MKTELIRGLRNLSDRHRGCVVTIGNFDGVHVGHQALLAKVTEKARELQAPSLVVIFEPQPFEFFVKERTAPRLTRWREKFCLFAKYGIDYVLIVRFNAAFAGLSPEEFVEDILVKTLDVKHVIVGDDFRFGHTRGGDVRYLVEAAARHGFIAEILQGIMMDGARISSTRVRKALAEANHERAARLLGHPYSVMGRVVHGDKRGRIIGFPTANIYLHRVAIAVQGVYIVRMHGLAEKGLPGVANVGTRPTVGGTSCLLEVHLFNFDKDIYGCHVSVEFCKKLREEIHFENVELLKEQILKDAENAENYFKARGEL